jgi:hypothetical protein
VTYECRLDASGWVPCASGVTYTGLAPGAHAFGVRATDAAGNHESPGPVVAFTAAAAPTAGGPAALTSASTSIPSRSSFVVTVPAPQLGTPTLARMLADAGAAVLARSTRHQLLAGVAVRAYAAGTATVTIDVSTRLRGRTVSITHGAAKVTVAGTHNLRLRPTAAGRRALAQPGRLALLVRATMAPGTGPAATARAAAHA